MADWTPEEQAELDTIMGEIEVRDNERDKEAEEDSEDGEESSDHAEDDQS